MKDQETKKRFNQQQLDDHDDGDQEVGNVEQETNPNETLSIKLTIAKAETTISDTGPVGNNNYSRVCEICNKWFSNGKALGGHMRMHYQQLKIQKQKPMNKKYPKNSNSNFTVGNNGGCFKKMEVSPVCFLCRKNFQSMKSLFGHMRSHPDRDWRGIQPPPPPPSISNNNVTSSSALSNSNLPVFTASDHDHPKINASDSPDDVGVNYHHDISDSSHNPLPKWSVTGKRGSKGIVGSSSDLEEKLNEAVQDLMMLASSDPRSIISDCSNRQILKTEVCHEVTNSNSIISLNKTQMAVHSLKNVDKGKGKALFESDDQFGAEKSLTLKLGGVNNHDQNKKHSESDIQNSECSQLGLISKMRKRRRKMKLEEADDIGDEIKKQKSNYDQYRCCECNKSFRTHQALGGHKSSHYKKQNKKSLFLQPNSESVVDQETYGEQVVDHEIEKVVHECKICNKIFSSGRGLGGHKKIHSVATNGVINKTESPGEASQTGPRVVLNFDLNEIPINEEEEEEDIGSSDNTLPENAASSNNSVA